MPATRLRLHLTSPCRLVVCAALICIAARVNAQNQKWKTYKYPADGFRISFPSEPKLEQSKKEAKSGSILMNSYCAQDSATYLCAAIIDQGPQATGLSPEVLLERTKMALVSAPKTHKISEEQIDLDGNKGVEIETESETSRIFTRIFTVGNTLYQTMVTVPVESHYLHAGRFLDSFRLIARPRY